MVSLELTSFSTFTLSAIRGVGVEVSSHSVARVSNVVDEVFVRSITGMHRLNPTGVGTSSSDGVLNHVSSTASSVE
jgi:hypothetical protein